MADGGGSVVAQRVRRAVLALVMVGLVVVLGVGGLWFRRLHRLTSTPAAPDVAGLTTSLATRQNDQLASGVSDSQLARLRERMPWAEHIGTAMADQCRADLIPNSWGGAHWSPVSCERDFTVYLAFDGDSQAHLAELDRTVAAMGWFPGSQNGARLTASPATQGQTSQTSWGLTYGQQWPATSARLTVDEMPLPADLGASGDNGHAVRPTGPPPERSVVVNVAQHLVEAADLGRAWSHSFLATLQFSFTYPPSR